ncbi:hypothetical protein B0H11DRAFT_2206437 [Mycena galericulata]|nr:hypothetical protein B0H11DRAFT_2206437 [Mycena galericulata]
MLPLKRSGRRQQMQRRCGRYCPIEKEDQGETYDTDTIADIQAQRPTLPVPQLTPELLEHFRLVRHTPSTTPRTRKSGSFVQIIQETPVPGLDVHDLIQSGVQLLDAKVSKGGLVFLSGRLQRPSFTEAELRVLCSAFNHRRQCRAAVELYFQWACWNTQRPPFWDFAGGGGKVELEMVPDDEEGAEWRKFFTWHPQTARWHELTWTDIRQQLALAGAGAERPQFSFGADYNSESEDESEGGGDGGECWGRYKTGSLNACMEFVTITMERHVLLLPPPPGDTTERRWARRWRVAARERQRGGCARFKGRGARVGSRVVSGVATAMANRDGKQATRAMAEGCVRGGRSAG